MSATWPASRIGSSPGYNLILARNPTAAACLASVAGRGAWLSRLYGP